MAGSGASSVRDLDPERPVFQPHSTDDAALPAPGATGDALMLSRSANAMMRRMRHDAAWTPTSYLPGRGPFPHFVERAKPGFIAVSDNGHRFVNEADPYQLFGAAMLALPRARPG